MSKRKGESYLGGHTLITLHPKLIEAGLVEQSKEHRKRVQEDQQKFDELRVQQNAIEEKIARKSTSPNRHAAQNAERFYKERLKVNERKLHLKPHPRIAAQLLQEQLELLNKIIKLRGKQLPWIRQRVYHTERKLERLLQR